MLKKIILASGRYFSIAIVMSVLSAAYWLIIASDRYVTESHVIIQRTDFSTGQGQELSSIFSGFSGGGRPEQLLLRDYLLSLDMLKKLDATLDLRSHYSDSRRDIISRMWFKDASVEWFYRYYLSRISVEFDDYSGVLIIKAQAYDPKTSIKISEELVHEGEIFMNHLAQQLAQTQVEFLEGQVLRMRERVTIANRDVLNFQDRRGLVSPQGTAEGLAAIVTRLEAQRSDLQTLRGSLQAYLVANHPNIIQLDQQIASVENQIAMEQKKLASPNGTTLNRTVEEFRQLEMQAEFAQDLYKTSLMALERGRVEATRTIKKMSVLQAPSLPEYALEPRRIYCTIVFGVIFVMLAGVIHLLAAVVRDHTD